MNQFYVYVLESQASHRIYIGQTNNVENRLERHNSGRVVSTRKKDPWRLLGFWKCETRSEAMKLEAKLKKLKDPELVRHLLKADNRIVE